MNRSLPVATASPTNHNSHPAAAAGSAVAQHTAHHPHRSRRRRARHRYRLLTLGITGLASPDPELIRAGYLAMGLLADAVLLPPALAAPITGILLALGTRWGLARHWWVTVKLVLTIGLATAAVFVLRPALNRGAAQALLVPTAELPTTGIGPTGIAVTLAPLGALPVLVTTVTLAVVKPWGQTRFQRH
jgi:hypothetical protein